METKTFIARLTIRKINMNNCTFLYSINIPLNLTDFIIKSISQPMKQIYASGKEPLASVIQNHFREVQRLKVYLYFFF